MPSSTYFRNFNIIPYSNTPAVDLTERIILQKSQQFNPYIFYPLSISDGVRADMVSNQVFNDPYASWVLYITNDVIDPYFDWCLTQEQFTNFIIAKYGTIQLAQQTIMYWQVDYTNTQPLTISAYNALDADQQQYWTPNFMGGAVLQNYVRKQVPYNATTNYTLQLSISGNTVSFANNEPLQISYVPGSNGTAQFVTGATGTIFVQHGQGDAFPSPNNPNTNVVIGSNSYVFGTVSGANAQITAVQFVANNIPIDELIYWSPVFCFDFEVQRNQGNRFINVMQMKYLPTFLNQTANLLSQVVK